MGLESADPPNVMHEMHFMGTTKCISCPSFGQIGEHQGNEGHFVSFIARKCPIWAENAKMWYTFCPS
jgi:hypothetical protein